MVTECGSLLPDWQSVSAIFSLYTIVFILMFVTNVWFIQHTRRKAATEVSTWVIFTHPALRLVLCEYQYSIGAIKLTIGIFCYNAFL